MNTSKSRLYLLLTILLCAVSQLHAQAGGLRFPESRSYSPGKLWLEWSPSERTGFVRGFIVGHDDGYRQACAISKAVGPHPSVAGVLDPCLKELHLFHNDLPYYAKFVTDFYTTYSEDRDVPLRILLLQADQKTPEQVHQWLATGSSE
jgi:hypothetical protein